MKSLSVIILSYNSREITNDCLLRLKDSFLTYPLDYEVIVVDNNSSDGSGQMLQELAINWPNLKVNLQSTNLGFTKGNNFAYSLSEGKYLLFLNSDVMIESINFNDLLAFLERYDNVGALTVKLLKTEKQIDPASHRGFPTLWRSLTYFLKLEKLFQHVPFFNRLFGGYHLIERNLDVIHEIDSPTGAFYLLPRKIFTDLKGFDEKFFMYGEDLDLSFRIKQMGYKIIYYPLFKAYHLKYKSGLSHQDMAIYKKTRFYFYDAWKIFYRKHYEKKNFFLVNQLVYLLIDLKIKLSS